MAYNPNVIKPEQEAINERRSFAIRTDVYFTDYEARLYEAGDATSEKTAFALAGMKKTVLDGLKKGEGIPTETNAFLLLAGIDANSMAESLKAKAAEEFFMRQAAGMFGEDPISMQAIGSKLRSMSRSIDQLKITGLSPEAKKALEAILLITPQMGRENPRVLFDRMQELRGVESLNGHLMEHAQMIISRLADSPSKEERDHILWDAQRLTQILYELRLIEKTLQEKLPTKASPSTRPINQPPSKPVETAQPVAKAASPERTETSSRERQEQEEIIAEVLKMGGVAVMTSMKSNELGKGEYAGFGTRLDRRWGAQIKAASASGAGEVEVPYAPKLIPIDAHQKGVPYGYAEDMFKQYQIDESVDLCPYTKKIVTTHQEDRMAGGMKGLFGMKEQVTIKGSKDVAVANISEVLPIDSKEPPFLLQYTAALDHNKTHKDYTGRGGNVLAVQLILPESLARKAVKMTRLDPSFMRRLVEASLLQNTTSITEGGWKRGEGQNERPLRPPYESWREANGGKSRMYVRDQTAYPEGDPKQASPKLMFREGDIVEF